MKCPYCGHENDEKATVCGKCYAGLPHETKEDKPVKATKRKKESES